MERERATMAGVGEKDFLRSVLPSLPVDHRFLNGFGHDASVLDLGAGDVALVLKIDRSPAPIATRHGWADAAVWARLAFTSVMSDLLVVGAAPTGFLLSLNVPSDWLARDVERIIAETSSLCSDAGVAFLGGDTKESSSPNIIGSGVGLVEKNSYLTRAGARPGQSLVLAGTLGGFMAAYLQMVMRKHDDGQAAQWIRYLSHPVARNNLFVLLDSVELGGATLASELDDLVQDIRGKPVRLVVACRTFAWSGFAMQPGGRKYMRPFGNSVFPGSSRVQPEADVRNLGRPVDIEPFGPQEFVEAWDRYRRVYGLPAAPNADRFPELRNPLLLRTFCEIFDPAAP